MAKEKVKRYKKIVYSLRWSPEIEVCFPKKVDIEELYERYKNFLKGWTVTHDSSIIPQGLEFKPKDSNHLYYNKESFSQVQDIISIIKGNKGYINNSCGGHIHIDMHIFNEKEIYKIIMEIISRQKYICQDFKVNNIRLNNQCKYITKNDIKGFKINHIKLLRDECATITDNVPVLQDKYYIVNLKNLQEYNSLEFRFFQPTLSISELKRRVKFLFEFIIRSLERE